ncbi:MAG TPA: beta-glucosidase BglX [Dinghuibacter sp.]|uniref:beta-glucosidase BglX n=1 Tax=Dinghuibacter sp. TaxID=2024697 RepID=UPI002BF5578F|nr:beta-glucosidase BglX [Dinghuibacter sp.]HTJ10708.1 beta-glucosidase BglX [Dinghuibacter sp.]
MKTFLLLALTCACVLTAAGPAAAQDARPAAPQDAKMKAFIDNLMSRMTLTEKLGQLNLPGAGDITTGQASNSDIAGKIRKGEVGGLFNIKSVDKIRAVQQVAVEQSRLKIPLIFGMDVIHGYETEFPIPLAMSCSWDTALIRQSARIAAIECSADGIDWTFSPMVDIARDPRWGRIAEGSGEDPFLGSAIARAMVKGYQGDLKADNEILACVKHFALYGAAEAGRDYNTTDMSLVRMFNEYMSPYKAAVDAGAGSVMSSFNDVNGVPATANRFLMTDVLRRRWGFKGFVVTDYTAVNELIAHGLGDLAQVSARSLMAGIDMDMVGEGFLTTLPASLKNGRATIAQVDLACRRILEAKYRLGLFTDPFKFCHPDRVKTDVFTPEHLAAERNIAAHSFVLLRNEGGLLPLKKGGSIALIGPLGDSRENMVGTWAVATDPSKAVSLADGLRAALGGNGSVTCARGANVVGDSLYNTRISVFGKNNGWDSRSEEAMIAEAVALASKSDVVVAALGESAEMTGECASRSDIGLPENQERLLRALLQTGKPVILVLFNGRPLAIPWESQAVPAILDVWFGGTEAGNAIADVLFGDVDPSGKLTTTWPQNVGQVPLYYSHMNTGRPLPKGGWFQKFRSNYLDVSNDPVYPFGYGLSYTTFQYSAPTLSTTHAKGNQAVTVSVTVTNTGTKAGEEVVQLYTHQLVGSITRPVKELRGFQKIGLQPGESRTVTFRLTPEDVKFYNEELKYDWEAGDFDIMTGGNSRDVQTVRLNWVK